MKLIDLCLASDDIEEAIYWAKRWGMRQKDEIKKNLNEPPARKSDKFLMNEIEIVQNDNDFDKMRESLKNNKLIWFDTEGISFQGTLALIQITKEKMEKEDI